MKSKRRRRIGKTLVLNYRRALVRKRGELGAQERSKGLSEYNRRGEEKNHSY